MPESVERCSHIAQNMHVTRILIEKVSLSIHLTLSLSKRRGYPIILSSNEAHPGLILNAPALSEVRAGEVYSIQSELKACDHGPSF